MLRIQKASVAAILEATGGIGFQNDLPWPKLKGDFAFLKWITTNQFSLSPDKSTLIFESITFSSTLPTVVIGRRTWESIGKRPLPKRRNVVVSSRTGVNMGIERISSVTEAPGDLVYFLGGASVYKDAMALVDAVFLTKVAPLDDNQVPPADVFFPLQELKEQGFVNSLDITHFVHSQLNLPTQLEDGDKFVENGFSYKFFVYFNCRAQEVMLFTSLAASTGVFGYLYFFGNDDPLEKAGEGDHSQKLVSQGEDGRESYAVRLQSTRRWVQAIKRRKNLLNLSLLALSLKRCQAIKYYFPKGGNLA